MVRIFENVKENRGTQLGCRVWANSLPNVRVRGSGTAPPCALDNGARTLARRAPLRRRTCRQSAGDGRNHSARIPSSSCCNLTRSVRRGSSTTYRVDSFVPVQASFSKRASAARPSGGGLPGLVRHLSSSMASLAPHGGGTLCCRRSRRAMSATSSMCHDSGLRCDRMRSLSGSGNGSRRRRLSMCA